MSRQLPRCQGGWVDLTGPRVAGTDASGGRISVTGAETVGTILPLHGPPPTLWECLRGLPYLPRKEWQMHASRAFSRWLVERFGLGDGALMLVPPRFPRWLRTSLQEGAGRSRVRVCDGAAAVRLALVAGLLRRGAPRAESIRVPGAGVVPVRWNRRPRSGGVLAGLGPIDASAPGQACDAPDDEQVTALALYGARALLGIQVIGGGTPLLLQRQPLLVIEPLPGTPEEVSLADGWGETPGRIEVPMGGAGRCRLGYRFADVPRVETAPFVTFALPAGAGSLHVDRRSGLVEFRRSLADPAGAPGPWPLAEAYPPVLL